MSRVYKSLADEGIRILALAFPYDAPPPESAGLPAREVKERLRQAKLSFNIAIILTIISGATTLTGLGLFFLEKIDDAKLITSGEIDSQIVSVGLLKINQEIQQLTMNN